MLIWLVNCEDLTCAWTKREDAIKYFKEEAKKCEWHYKIVWGSEEEKDWWVEYKIWTDDDPKPDRVTIESVFLDEKPYLDNNTAKWG